MIPIKSKLSRATPRSASGAAGLATLTRDDELGDLHSGLLQVPSGRGPSTPPGLSETPDPVALLKALRRRWPLLLGLGFVAAGLAAAAAWFLLAAPFKVYGQLHFAPVQPRILFDTPSEGNNDFRTYLRNQAFQIKSRFVLNAALKRDEVRGLAMVRNQADAAAWLEEELKVEQGGTEMLTLSLSNQEPGEAAALINALMQVYLQEVNNTDQKRRSDRLAEMNDIYNNAKEKLRQDRDTLRRLSEDVGSNDTQSIAQRQAVMLTNYSDMKRQHSQVKFELMRAQARLAPLLAQEKKLDTQPIAEGDIEAIIDNDATVLQHLDKLAQLEAIVKEYEQVAANPNEYGLVVGRRRHREVSEALEERRKVLRKNVQEQLVRKRRQEFEEKLQVGQLEVASLVEQEKAMLTEVERLGKETGKISSTSTEYVMLQSDIDKQDRICNRVGEEIQALQVELRSPARVSLYQEAVVQKTPAKKQIMGTAAAPFAAFALVAVGLGWWEFRHRRIQGAEDVALGLGLRVLGSVPTVQAQEVEQLFQEGAFDELGNQAGQEALDGIRTILARDPSFADPRVLLVTAANRGEGKTLLATQLALSFSKTGHKTLLIDGDLCNPTLHDLFDTPFQPGLAEAVRKVNDISEIVYPTEKENLFIIPAGERNAEVLRALARNGFPPVLEGLKSEFEYIVIDSTSVLAATDALLMGPEVDAVILSLLKDVSQAPRVYAAYRRMATLNIRVIGAIINGLAHDKTLVA